MNHAKRWQMEAGIMGHTPKEGSLMVREWSFQKWCEMRRYFGALYNTKGRIQLIMESLSRLFSTFLKTTCEINDPNRLLSLSVIYSSWHNWNRSFTVQCKIVNRDIWNCAPSYYHVKWWQMELGLIKMREKLGFTQFPARPQMVIFH